MTYWNRFCAPFIRARLARTERGASLVEYALLVALIAVVCIGAVTLLGGNANSKLGSAASSI
jgi:pilus assembly protein Flp/PilA